MATPINKIPSKTIALGVVFVFLGFGIAFLLFKFLTKPKQAPLTNLIASIEQKPVNANVQLPVPDQVAIDQYGEPEVVESVEVIVEKAEKPVVEKYIDREMPSLVLNGVFASETGSYALINNRIVKEGETILGAKVVRIYSNKVELDAFGKEMVLRVK